MTSDLSSALDELLGQAAYVESCVSTEYGFADVSIDRMLSESLDVCDRMGYVDGIRHAVSFLRGRLRPGEVAR